MKVENSCKQRPVAIIGIGCIFPDSPDAKAFLKLLLRGRSAISDPPETHRHLLAYLDSDPKKPDHIYCNRGGYLPQVEFDPSEFGIPPSALEATDTSQLLGLLVAKRALADAGYGQSGRSFDRSKTSVVLGVTGTQELAIPLGARLGHPIWRKALSEEGIPKDTAEAVVQRISDSYVSWQENSFPGLLGNVVAGRIANRLDLGGTNCVVDAACASSMSALHVALLELMSDRADMVLTGGVDTINDAFMHMCFSKTHILSAQGDIRPFSQEADGTVLGEGIGMVVLKRLEEARRDKDRIYAVIRGIGSASDGKSQSIYSPRQSGQVLALNRAYANAGVDPVTVELVEAHGTGTRVGDQVEFKALCEVFGNASSNGNRCALGTVKSNIGHTKAAAGTAGLIKATLSLYNKVLPPTLKAQPADSKLGVDHSPFYLNHSLRPWVVGKDRPRRAGVSAFGFGGSNFHTVLEEYESRKQEPSWDGSVEIVAFSAQTQEELIDSIRCQSGKISIQAKPHEISTWAGQCRQQFNAHEAYRALIVLNPVDAGHIQDRCRAALKKLIEGGPAGSPADGVFIGHGQPQGEMAFLFPGQGSQYASMGRDLLCCFPTSLEAFQEAEQYLEAEHPLNEYVYPRLPGETGSYDQRLRSTQIAQPAIGAVSVAMQEAVAYFGIAPAAVCGHSYGELVALHAAGCIDRTTLWRLSVARGHFMSQAGLGSGDPGTMLAISAPMAEIEQWLAANRSSVVLANRNSPFQAVLSGASADIAAVEKAGREKTWKMVRLPVAAAFHSSLMASAQAPFQKVVQDIEWRPGAIRVLSNTSGDVYPSDTVQAKQLLGGQLAKPVDFVSNIEQLYAMGVRTFIEVGPKSVLTGLVNATLKGKSIQAMALDRSAGRQSGLVDLASILAQLAAAGYDAHLERWEKAAPQTIAPRMRIPLSGTNYRDQKQAAPAASEQRRNGALEPPAPPIKPPAPVPTDPRGNAQNTSPGTHLIPKTPYPVPKGGLHTGLQDRKAEHTMEADQKTYLNQALTAVQQGLAAMQAMQAQTTQAHQKYLEAQAEASRTLQQMVQSAQQLSATFLGLPPAETVSAPIRAAAAGSAPNTQEPLQPLGAAHVQPPAPVFATPRQVPPTEIYSVQTTPVPNPAVLSTPAAPQRLQVAESHDGLSQNLVLIVSRLTGYPEEMLGLEMDIEADLGIDSIKRVEILSALEEEMPHLPKVTPDMVGTLKTLGHICDYLSAGAASSQTGLNLATQAASPPPVGKSSGTPSVGPSNIQQILVHIVSRLTGYPEEMLGMEMDIEADLGIDSIKRVEILSAVEEEMPHLPKVTPDMVGTLKSLGQIRDYLSGPQPKVKIQVMSPVSSPSHSNKESEDISLETIGRYVLRSVPLPKKPSQAFAPAQGHRIVAVAATDNALANALVDQLGAMGVKAQRVSAPEEIQPDMFLAGLMLLEPLPSLQAFAWAKRCGAHLQLAAKKGDAIFSTVTRLDGAFGLKGQPSTDPEQGALAGLIKTAALEWTGVRCKAIDLDPLWTDISEAAHAIAMEIVENFNDPTIEVGLGPEGRTGLQMVPEACGHTAALQLSADEVVVVSGGGRGVTAAAAMALAEHTHCRIALLGRSPNPQPEPEWLAPLEDEAQIKQAILQRWTSQTPPTPKALESDFRQRMANREVLHTLVHLQQKGIRVRYDAVDVRDVRAVADAIEAIRRDLGPIKALIHGAGVLQDRLIVEKSVEQFQAVYDTKVEGLRSLLTALQNDDLHYLVLFSSVSARMGNLGQADYAMANEALNKMAAQQAGLRPQCKVVAINWGPWDGGMVTPALKRSFESNGIRLIPIAQGAAAMVAEMGLPRDAGIEVVIGGPLRPETLQASLEATHHRPKDAPAAKLTQAVQREIDAERCPVLQAHRLDGRPVVPLALMAEWLAHGALHANPGLSLYGIDQLRLLKGIALDQPIKTIRLMAGSPKRNGEHYEVDVEIRDGAHNGGSLVHSSAKAILTDRLPSAPPFEENGHFKATRKIRPLEEIYRQILFHGDALRGIERIVRLSKHGMTAQVRSAPSPDQWLDDPMRSRWIADPLVLDCAFQMAIIWCYEQQGLVSLPSYAASYRQYRERFPVEGVAAVMEVVKVTERKLVADYTFLDREKKVIACMKGYEAMMDPNLLKAFGVASESTSRPAA
jgi:acyl transferase domain-containing protein